MRRTSVASVPILRRMKYFRTLFIVLVMPVGYGPADSNTVGKAQVLLSQNQNSGPNTDPQNPSVSPSENKETTSDSKPSSTWLPEGSFVSKLADWASVIGVPLAVFSLIVAIRIYRRQGREQTALSQKQTEEFKNLTGQQTDQFRNLQTALFQKQTEEFKNLTDQQTDQFGKLAKEQTTQFDSLVRQLSYEVHPIDADEALQRVVQWFEDENLINFEFFSTFSVVPLFWDDEHRVRKATDLLSDRKNAPKVKLVGPSPKQSERDFHDVASLLVNTPIDNWRKISRAINWLTDAMYDIGELEDDDVSNPSFQRVSDSMDKLRIENRTALLIDPLAKRIASGYRWEEQQLKPRVFYREQVTTLTVNYALARFRSDNPTETFEMLVFSDPEENLFSLTLGQKSRAERILSTPLIYHTRNRLLMRATCDPVKTILMKVNREQVNALPLWNIQHSIDELDRGTVLILPNAYGILSYQEPLATQLAYKGWNVYWVAFSGQGVGGELSFKSALADLSEILKHLELNSSKPLSVIAHGVSALAILEYLKTRMDQRQLVSKLIITGMPVNLKRVIESNFNEIDAHNVCARFTSAELEYDPIPAVVAVDIPILFCHAKDDRHLTRASKEEMQKVVNANHRGEVCWFDKGYDDGIEPLSLFVEKYVSWLSLDTDERAV